MSTRSMTVVAQPYSDANAFVPLYRHSDGYPAEAGKAIVDVLETFPTCCEDIVAKLLSLRYDSSPGRTYPEPIYRAATWGPADQGDLEHVYELRPDLTTQGGVRPAIIEWTVKHYARRGWGPGSDDYTHWNATTYTLEDFKAFMEREAGEIMRRIEKRNSART